MGNVAIFKGSRAYFLNNDGFEHPDGRLNIYVDTTPEGSITAPVGSIANDRTNGILYYKGSGVGNTGWIPSVGAVSVMQYRGAIAVNTDFPLIASVQAGWFYTITANVTDNAGVLYTNTGDSFTAGQEIAWDGAAWVIVADQNEFRFFATVVNAEAATGQDGWTCYVLETDSYYRYLTLGAAYTDNNTTVLSTGDGGNTRWIATSGRYSQLNLRNWATGIVYAQNDIVLNDSILYRALSAHTAGATFAGDVALSRWGILETDTLGIQGRQGAEEIDGAVNLIDTDIQLLTTGAGSFIYDPKIIINNRNNAVVQIRIAIIDGALGAVANEDYFEYDSFLQPYEMKEIKFPVIPESYTVLVRSDTVDVNFSCFGTALALDRGWTRLGASTVVADTDTALYVATGRVDDIFIIACNRDPVNSANISLAAIDGAIGAWADEDNIVPYDNEIILEGETRYYNLELSLANTHTIGVRSTDSDVHFIAFGRTRL